jgi:hypothetical protein
MRYETFFQNRLPWLLSAAVALGAGCGVDPAGHDDDHHHAVEGDGEGDPSEPQTRRAKVWASDPVSDDELTDVELVETISDDGSLTGQFVNALNCVNKPGGQSLFGFASLCVEEHTVHPDDDDDFLHIEPPGDESDQEDPFAELMMFHHVNIMHDYYRGTHGFEGLDFPLDAVTNVSINMQGQWQSFPNAAFMPEETFAAFGMPAREFGAIMFGQGDPVDFSYDASVIYHEYSHAMVGTGRLQGAFTDSQGLNNTPGAINEAVADYFASSLLDAALVGPYALGASYARDLADKRTCPEDLTTEIHADGKIVGSALWSVREAVGVDVADAAAFGAVQAAQLSTGFVDFGELVLAEAARLSPDDADVVEGILAEHGLLGCERVKTWEDVNLALTTGLPYAVEGRQSVPGAYPDGVPAYLQLQVPRADAPYIELEWQIADTGGSSPFGQAAAPISLALRSAQPIVVGDNGAIETDSIIDSDFVQGTVQRVVVDAACADDGLFTLFVNKGNSTASVSRLGIRTLDEVPDNVEVASCR